MSQKSERYQIHVFSKAFDRGRQQCGSIKSIPENLWQFVFHYFRFASKLLGNLEIKYRNTQWKDEKPIESKCNLMCAKGSYGLSWHLLSLSLSHLHSHSHPLRSDGFSYVLNLIRSKLSTQQKHRFFSLNRIGRAMN